MSLSGKIFAVTGGASGIGKATVKKLLAQGATVHALDLADIPSHARETGEQLSYSKVDIGSRSQVSATFSKISAHHKGAAWIDGLVNCAGLFRVAPCSNDAEGDELFKRMWQVNVMGAWHMTTELHAYLQQLRQSDGSRFASATTSIVNVGSMASVRGLPGMTAYVASKHAILGLSRTLAQELGPQGFRVNTVGPGAVNTPMIAGKTPGVAASAAYTGAFKNGSEPEEIAETITFLLGDGASSISGQLLEVNGGWP